MNPQPASGASASEKDRGQEQRMHEVACMAARAAAGQIRNETPDEAANIVAEAYLRAIGLMHSDIQTTQDAWDAAATLEAGRLAGLSIGRSISKVEVHDNEDAARRVREINEELQKSIERNDRIICERNRMLEKHLPAQAAGAEPQGAGTLCREGV